MGEQASLRVLIHHASFFMGNMIGGASILDVKKF